LITTKSPCLLSHSHESNFPFPPCTCSPSTATRATIQCNALHHHL
jgi:hypothetical protein